VKKKVLIISYFFEPCKLVGAERTTYWAHNLSKKGFYPIILTRQWNQDQIELTDLVFRNKYEHIKNDKFEVYKLPYRRTLRDILAKHKKLMLLQKTLTFLESFFSNFFISSLPFSNFKKTAAIILKTHPEISHVINSVAPFQALFISYKLKQQFYDKTFIADYRDEWTTRSTNSPKNSLEKILFYLNNLSEKKWTSNLDYFITVSDTWKKSISNQINKKGFVIKNGYDFKDFEAISKNSKGEKLKIIYPGTLFSYQKIEIFINTIIKIHDNFPDSVQVDFYGVEVNKIELKRLKSLTNEHKNIFKIHNKIHKIELAKELNNSDVGLLTNYENLKGCLPVKIFDYYYFGLTILLCPSDNDEMQNFLDNTNSGFSVNNEEECFFKLKELVRLKKQGKLKRKTTDETLFFHYSRENQSSILVNILKTEKV
jgi:hypothetical protein